MLPKRLRSGAKEQSYEMYQAVMKRDALEACDDVSQRCHTEFSFWMVQDDERLAG